MPGRNKRKTKVRYDKRICKWRNCTKIMFGRLKYRRGVANRYDRYLDVFTSAIVPAATLISWLCIMTLNGEAFTD